MMIATESAIEKLTLSIREEIRVRAPIDVTFATLIEQLGPFNEVGENRPLPMKLEPWPGGRWYRDLGESNGHLWGRVQAMKRPTLARNQWTTDHVLPDLQQSAIPLE